MTRFAPCQTTSEPFPLELLDALRRRKEEAWRAFYAWSTPFLYGYGRRRGLVFADCQSLAQEVLIAALEAVAVFHPDGRPYPVRRWLSGIAAHLVADLLGRPRPELMDPGKLDCIVTVGAVGAEAGEAPGADRCRAALARIRPEFKERSWQAFELAGIHQFTSNAAGALLGMKPEAVRQAKSRVARRLRAELHAPGS